MSATAGRARAPGGYASVDRFAQMLVASDMLLGYQKDKARYADDPEKLREIGEAITKLEKTLAEFEASRS